MIFQLDDDVVARVVLEETLGLEPNARTQDVPNEFRLKIRAQVAAIKAAGGSIDIPRVEPAPGELTVVV